MFSRFFIKLLIVTVAALILAGRDAQAEPVGVPLHFVSPFDRGPVFVNGTFTNGEQAHPDYELTDPDDDGEWSAIVEIEPGIHHYRFRVDSVVDFRDPDILDVDTPWGHSELVVTDPMIVYLLPLNGKPGLRAGEAIRAVFGFSDANPIDPATIELSINGEPVSDAASYYDPSIRELRYSLPMLLDPGSYTVEVSASSSVGSANRTHSFERAPAVELLTEDITYRQSNVVAYGRLNDPDLEAVAATLNGAPVALTIIDGRFTVAIALEQGINEIEITGTDGFGNSVFASQQLIAELDRRPEIEIQANVLADVVSVNAVGQSFDGSNLSYQWVNHPDNSELLTFSDAFQLQTSFPIPATDGEYLFDVLATDVMQNTHSARRILWVEDGVARLNEINDHAEWIEHAIIYELQPELATPYGNLNDAFERLPAIADLGVNTILLTPIFATEDWCTLGYGTTDFYGVCQTSGHTQQDFRDFVDQAHALGLRVMLDLAISHTGIRHTFMQNIMALNQDSPFTDFYIWDGVPGNSQYQHENLLWHWPWINYENTETRDYMIDVAEYWLQEFELDGFRLDVADHIDTRSPTFFPEFRRRLKNVRPESYLLAEVGQPSPKWYDERVDSSFDMDLRGWGFADENVLIRLFDGDATIDELHNVLVRDWGETGRPVRFVEQHDHPRMAALYDLDRSKLAHALISTVPGIPYFFAGGEVGHAAPTYDVDTPVDWDDSLGVRPYFQSLLTLRRERIRSDGQLIRLTNSTPAAVYSFLTESDNGRVVTLLNFSPSVQSGSMNAESLGSDGYGHYRFGDVIDLSSFKLESESLSQFQYSLDPYQALVYSVDPAGHFDDVEPNYWSHSFIQALADSGITSGCGNDNYCPEQVVTRAQMAVFLERSINGSDFLPPPATGTMFGDVGVGDFAAAFIEQLASEGITAGCGNGNYCPGAVVTRAQMAVFLLRAKYGSGYAPPSATGVFGDVGLAHWAVHWIEQLAADGITSGCGGGNYCPDDPVTRDQMAVFLVRTFDL